MSIALVTIEGQTVVDSRIIAKGLGIAHKSFVVNIRRHEKELQQFGSVRFEVAPDSSTFSLLNEDQAIFVLTLSRNTPQVVQCKINLVKAFSELKSKQKTSLQSIANEKDQGKLRLKGKEYRRTYTDRIQQAGGKGSDYAKATNETYLGATGMTAKQIKEQRGIVKGKPARDGLNLGELQIVSMTEWQLAGALPEDSTLGDINQASRSQAERLKAALMVWGEDGKLLN